MGNNKLADNLLKLDAANHLSESDAHQQTERILCRNRRWVFLLGGLTIFFALLAVCGFLFGCWMFYLKIFAPLSLALHQLTPHEVAAQPDLVRDNLHRLYWFWMVSLAFVAITLAALTLTALSSVWLMLASRRATIRHVNSVLTEISRQLKKPEPGKDESNQLSASRGGE
jgi:hypothetical protein